MIQGWRKIAVQFSSAQHRDCRNDRHRIAAELCKMTGFSRYKFSNPSPRRPIEAMAPTVLVVSHANRGFCSAMTTPLAPLEYLQ
jgi:hypothetical protein